MSVSRKFFDKRLIVAVIMVFASITSILRFDTTYAAQITTRSLTLVANGTVGGSTIGGVVNHLFTFSIPSTTTVGSIQFLYCTTASIATCVLPTGMVTTSATIGSQSGVMTGFTMVNTTNGAPYLTRTAAAPSAGAETIQLNTITNPTTAGGVTFFVRISTFATTNATGGTTDTGSVAASTANQIVLNGTMPESLTFCAGGTISKTGGVPDCTTATTATVLFNQLFSPTDTATATSQFAASTNAASGYSVTVNGSTLQSGGNSITAMSTAGLGVRGTAQFGMNLKLNTTLTSTPAVGAEVSNASDGVNLRGQAIPSSGYDVVDNFKFVSGNAIANSGYTVLGPTNAQIFTVSYIVNVPGNQPPGLYSTTLTYICTATY